MADTDTPQRQAASAFSLSEAATNLLKEVETLRLTPYDDQTGNDIGAWVKGATIGYGHLIQKADWGRYRNGITEAGAGQLLADDLGPSIAVVQESITAAVSQNEFDAMVILAFNIGPGFAQSSVVKLINDPAAKTGYKNLESAWKAWNKSQGKVMQGLVNRRQCEWNIFSLAIYARW